MAPNQTQSLPRSIQKLAEQATPLELATLMPAFRELIKPAYPGTEAGSKEMSSATLKIWWGKTPVLQLLREFAERPMGTDEFPYADKMRALVSKRLSGAEGPANTLNYLAAQKNVTMRSAMRSELAVCLAVFELEHLPQHIEFFKRYREADWLVQDCAPMRVIAISSLLAAGERSGLRRTDEFIKFSHQIKRALTGVSLELLQEALSLSTKKYEINQHVLEDLAYRRRNKEPEAAQAMLSRDESTEGWVRRIYQNWRPHSSASSLVNVATSLSRSLCGENMDAILTRAVKALAGSYPASHAALKANWKEITAHPTRSGEVRYLTEYCPSLTAYLSSRP